TRREPAGGLAGPGQQHDPRGRAVKPMHQPDVHVARLAVFLLEIPTGLVDKRLSARRVALGRQPGRLVDREAMVVLVEHLEVHAPACWASVIRLTRIVAYDPFGSPKPRRRALRPG